MFKVGDKVRIKDDLEVDEIYNGYWFNEKMKQYINRIAEIKEVVDENFIGNKCYKIDIDNNDWCWTDKMLKKVKKDKFKPILDYEEEEKMNFDKILEIYKERIEKQIEKKFDDKYQKLKENDEIQKIYLETENQINVMLDRDEDNRFELPIINIFTEKTQEKMDKLSKEYDADDYELRKILEEVHAQLDAVPNYDYEIGFNILKTYGILDKEGKINA